MGRHRYEAELRRFFGREHFRPGQARAVDCLMRGRDLLCVFPTGAGKSLCYQLPAMLLPGVTLVVSPLISLMRDQVQGLRRQGIPAVYLDSLQSREEQAEALRRVAAGEARLVYAAPERLELPGFSALLRRVGLSLLVVDEAHCAVQWGESFRPAYARIGDFLSTLERRPVVCAMTATADRKLRRAIIGSVGLRRPMLLTLPLTRENLRYRLVTTIHPREELLRCLRAHEGEKCIVFCRTRAQTEHTAELLRQRGMAADFYHAGLDRARRSRVQEEFSAGRLRVLAATSAFGMGVDVPDIRLVVHCALPENLTDYAQQSGRAGRDGQVSECVLLLDPADVRRAVSRMRREEKQAGFRLRRRLAVRRQREEYRRVLGWCLSGRCLPAGLSAFFGQRSAPCGHCSACLRKTKGPLAPVPVLNGKNSWETTAWALEWQVSALPDRGGLTGQAVREAARSGCLPVLPQLPPERRERLRQLLEHMRG